MNNHTPGPWNAGCFIDPDTTCDCKYIFSEGYHGSVAEISVDNGKRIGDGGNDSPALGEAIANARLIASAPDMYEALISVTDDLESEIKENYPDYLLEYPHNRQKMKNDMERVISARAILDKVEGRI